VQAYTSNTKKRLKWLWDAGRMEVTYRPPAAASSFSSSAAPAGGGGRGGGGSGDATRTLQCGTLAGLVLAWLAEAPGEEYPVRQAVADLGLSEEHAIRVVATLTIGVGVLAYKGVPPQPPGARPRKPRLDDVLVVAPGFRPAKHVRTAGSCSEGTCRAGRAAAQRPRCGPTPMLTPSHDARLPNCAPQVIRVPAPTPPLDTATGSEATVEDRKFVRRHAGRSVRGPDCSSGNHQS
jgi:hypothetical protein